MMKKYFFILISFLAGCVTHISDPVQSTEQIHAFMIEGDKIYLVGEQSDYLLQNQDVKAMESFLKSPYAKQTLFLTMRLENLDNEVKGEYVVYLDERQYNEAEKKQLQKQFWFNPISYIHPDLLPAVQRQHKNWQVKQGALKRQYRAFGKRVRFKDRTEILQKYAMQKALNVPLTSRISRKEVIADEIAVGVLFFPVSVAYSVVFIAVATPVLASTAMIYMLKGESLSK